LNELFKEKEYLPYVPFPTQYPEPIPMTPYYITCSIREDK